MKVLVILITFLISYSATAEEKAFEFKRGQIKTINVVAPMWEDYTNADGSGMYWDIIRSIYVNENIKLKTSTVPWNRAMKMVTKYQTYNAIVGEYRETEENLLFPKYPIDVEYLSVLSTKETGQWQGLASLAGKRVGWVKDYDVIPSEERNFSLREYRTTEQGLDLLNEGKLDYIIDEWDELALVLKGKDLSIQTDTLQYLYSQKKTFFYGETDIQTEDATMYCESGWYNTEPGEGTLQKNAFISREKDYI